MVRKSMTQHDTCQWPPKQECRYDPLPGVRCAPIKEEYRLEHDLPQKPDFAVDHKEPIVVEWPPKQPHIGQGDCCEQDTGIRDDLLNKIPTQIIPQAVTVHGAPAPDQTQSPIQHAKLNHPLCPDGLFHMEINPPHPAKPEIRIPDLGCAVRQPVRPWRQCIENTLINDRVRRPMARWCHKRPMPPLVIPTHELQRLKDKCTEPERKAKEREDRIRQRECQRLESRRRMAKWNYTVESLLERKKEKDDAKERQERESLQQLMKDIKAGKDQHSAEQIARAKKLTLYGKGLIKDFHSALAFSKMMQDIERSRQKTLNDKDEELEKTLPICDTKCMKRMIRENDRPEYEKIDKKNKPKRINEKLLKTLQSIETRQMEQKCEVEARIRATKQMLKDNLPDLPQAYLKRIAEPVCEEVSSTEKFMERRNKFFDEIDDKLAVDAYIESHEKEVERQACEYAKYKLHKDLIRKQTEERLIKEKVLKNIAKSEAAAKVLVEMRAKKQKESAFDYDALKEKWEEEIKEKEEEKKEQQQKIMDAVVKDFWERKGVEKCKWQMRDVSRLWARERLVAVENYEQECQRKNTRRQQAEENQLYNLALASEKKCQQEREKMIENAWAEKIKGQYFAEMQEMKDYAQDCIRDWVGKGRSPIPMHMAMKKWEHDSQMDPRMFRIHEEKKRLESGEDERGAGDADGYALLLNSQKYLQNNSNASSETTQATARRLGFC